jgi:hypothetical protein
MWIKDYGLWIKKQETGTKAGVKIRDLSTCIEVVEINP